MHYLSDVAMRMRIAMGLLDQIMSHAATAPDREVCGLLLGDDEHISDAIAADNVHPDPARFFEADPRTLFAAIRAERAGGPRLIGHYHSHPGGMPDPSARDAAAAGGGLLWLIVTHDSARLFSEAPGAPQTKGFREVTLIISEDVGVGTAHYPGTK